MYLEKKIDQRGGRVEFIHWANISTLVGGGWEVGNDQVRLTRSFSTYLAKEPVANEQVY